MAGGGDPLRARDEAIERYEALARVADELAKALSVDGSLLGRVALDSEPGGTVEVLIPPERWVETLTRAPELVSPGYYLLAVDPKTMSAVLLVSEEATLSSLQAPGSRQSHVDLDSPVPAAGDVVMPIRIKARLASSKHLAGAARKGPGAALGELLRAPGGAAGAPPDPNSPVVAPTAEVVESMLFSEPGDSYTLGALGVLDLPYRTPGGALAPFPLPWSVARKHILITGTTGSGKTSLVKNLLVNAVWRHECGTGETLDILVLDASGDYRVAVLPGSPSGPGDVLGLYSPAWRRRRSLKAVIALPVTGVGDPLDQAVEYAEWLMTEEALVLAGRPSCTWSYSLAGRSPAVRVRGECYTAQGRSGVDFIVAPIAMKAGGGEVLSLLARTDPFLSERAREAAWAAHRQAQDCSRLRLGDAVNSIVSGVGEAAKKSGRCGDLGLCARSVCEALRGFHESTLKNLEGRLRYLRDSGVVADKAECVLDADYSSLSTLARRVFGGVSVVVADLDYPARRLRDKVDTDRLKVLVGFRLLSSFAAYKERAGGRAFLVIDEAHLFFPGRTGGGWEAEGPGDLLARVIRNVTRLGRSRGISVVFSTHRPSDVDRLILTLANTRIYLRTDVRTARELELPEGLRARLPFFRDHAGIVESYYIRGGYATFVGGPSVLGHRLA